MSAKTAQGRENPQRHLTKYRTLWDHGPRVATRATSKIAIGRWKMAKGKWQVTKTNTPCTVLLKTLIIKKVAVLKSAFVKQVRALQ